MPNALKLRGAMGRNGESVKVYHIANDSMFVGKNSQLGKHGFGSL